MAAFWVVNENSPGSAGALFYPGEFYCYLIARFNVSTVMAVLSELFSAQTST